MTILETVRQMWRRVTRADEREALARRRQGAEAALAKVPEHWRMVRDVLGDDVDDGLTGHTHAR